MWLERGGRSLTYYNIMSVTLLQHARQLRESGLLIEAISPLTMNIMFQFLYSDLNELLCLEPGESTACYPSIEESIEFAKKYWYFCESKMLMKL